MVVRFDRGSQKKIAAWQIRRPTPLVSSYKTDRVWPRAELESAYAEGDPSREERTVGISTAKCRVSRTVLDLSWDTKVMGRTRPIAHVQERRD